MRNKILVYTIYFLTSVQLLVADGFSPEDINNKALHSEDPAFNVGLKAGTLGLGLDISKPINEFVSLRFNMNKFTYNTTDTSRYNKILHADKEYDLNTKGVLLDFYVLQLRLTAGLYKNDNVIKYSSTPKGSNPIILNGTRYGTSILRKVESTVSFNSVAPYLGVGWGNNGNREGWGGWNLTLDVGLMYHGAPEIDIDLQINDNVPITSRSLIAENLKIERKKQEKDLSDFPFYPVVMVGLNYSF